MSVPRTGSLPHQAPPPRAPTPCPVDSEEGPLRRPLRRPSPRSSSLSGPGRPPTVHPVALPVRDRRTPTPHLCPWTGGYGPRPGRRGAPEIVEGSTQTWEDPYRPLPPPVGERNIRARSPVPSAGSLVLGSERRTPPVHYSVGLTLPRNLNPDFLLVPKRPGPCPFSITSFRLSSSRISLTETRRPQSTHWE